MTAKEQLCQLWAARIADYRASGLTMSAWCAANSCTVQNAARIHGQQIISWSLRSILVIPLGVLHLKRYLGFIN